VTAAQLPCEDFIVLTLVSAEDQMPCQAAVAAGAVPLLINALQPARCSSVSTPQLQQPPDLWRKHFALQQA
jgi:hypothetical protein